jgi:hypothetical protein
VGRLRGERLRRRAARVRGARIRSVRLAGQLRRLRGRILARRWRSGDSGAGGTETRIFHKQHLQLLLCGMQRRRCCRARRLRA